MWGRRLWESIEKSLYRKVLLSIVTAVFVAITLYIVIYIHTVQKRIIKDSLGEAAVQLASAKEQVEKNAAMLEVAAQILNTNRQLIEIAMRDMEKEPVHTLWELKTQNLRFLSNVSDIVPDLKLMRVYSKENESLEIWPTIYSMKRLENTGILEQLAEENVIWQLGGRDYVKAETGFGECYISRFCKVRNSDDCVIETGMAVEDFFGEKYASVSEEQTLVILTQDDTFFYNERNPYVLRLLEQYGDLPKRLRLNTSGQDGTFLLEDGREDVVIFSSNQTLGVSLYYIVSNLDAGNVARRARDSTILLIVGITLLIMTLLSLVLHYFLKKISVLETYMYHIQDAGMEVEPIHLGKDEVGNLAEVFNKTVSAVKSLTQSYLEEMEKRHQADLKLLQHQINWHFIYNTLNAIEMHAIVDGDEKIADAVSAFGSLLQYSAEGVQLMVPLREEIVYIQNFTELINMQYDKHLNLEVRIPETLLEVLVPKMLLQPIVENSFEHGMLPAGKNGKVTIMAVLQGEDMELSVEDDGIGVTEEKLLQIYEILQQESGVDFAAEHIALQNADRRIKALYGPKYGLRIESDGSTWTRVTVRLRVQTGVRDICTAF